MQQIQKCIHTIKVHASRACRIASALHSLLSQTLPVKQLAEAQNRI